MNQAQGPIPKKILHVLPGAVGGATMSALGLMEAFRARGIMSCAVCHDMGTELRSRLEELTNGELLFLPLYWWNRKIRSALWKRPLIEARQALRTGSGRLSAARVAAFARQHGAELIHTCTIMTPEGGRAARLLGLPHVWHVRELIGEGHPFRLPIEGPKLGRWMTRRASKVVANSNVTASCVRDWLPGELLEVVPNGIDLSRFNPRASRGTGPLVVAMVGSMAARWKRHDLFVEMGAALRSKPDAVELRIYGEAPEGDPYAQGIKERATALKVPVKFMGAFSDPAKVMPELDILVQPTDGESFGRVTVEAMACAVPVVAVNGGGGAEIVVDGESGLLSPVGDALALAANVDRLVAEPGLRERLGQGSRRRAENRYSLGACADGMERVYRAAAQRPLSLLG